MAGIKVTVGASLDRSTLRVFKEIADAAKKARSQVAQDERRAQRDAEREQRRAANQIAQEQRNIEKQKEREARRTANVIAHIQKETAREQDRITKNSLKEAEKAKKAQARAAVAALKEEQREIKKVGEMHAREATRVAKDWAELKGKMVGGAISGTARGAMGAARLAGRGMRFAAGVGMDYAHAIGVDTSLSSYMHKNAEMEQGAAWLSNASYQHGAKGPAGVRQDPNKLIKESFDIGSKTGFGGNEVLEGLREFVKVTGDLETGRQEMERLAILAKATGADMSDMANAAGNAANQLGDIPNKAEVLDDVMRSVAGQGHLGALEIRDLAKEMAKVAAMAQQIEGSSGDNIKLLGAITQEGRLRGGAATASQAATATMSMFSSMKQSGTIQHWKDLGLDPYSKKQKGMFKNPQELIIDALKAVGMDTSGKFSKLFGGARGGKAVGGFQSIYQQAYSATQGTDADKQAAGVKAVNDEFARLKNVIIEEEELRESFAIAMGTGESQAQKLNNALQEATMQFQKELTPALVALMPALTNLTKETAKSLSELLGINTAKDAVKHDQEDTDKVLNAQAKAIQTGSVVNPEEMQKRTDEITKQGREDIARLRSNAAGARASKHSWIGRTMGGFQGIIDAAGGVNDYNNKSLAHRAQALLTIGGGRHSAFKRGEDRYSDKREDEARALESQAGEASARLDLMASNQQRVADLLENHQLKVVIMDDKTKGKPAAPKASSDALMTSEHE
jgi:hypothetical protein